jgi:hypothetical protein
MWRRVGILLTDGSEERIVIIVYTRNSRILAGAIELTEFFYYCPDCLDLVWFVFVSFRLSSCLF